MRQTLKTSMGESTMKKVLSQPPKDQLRTFYQGGTADLNLVNTIEKQPDPEFQF